MHSLYATVLAEVARLRRTGGIELRGRTPIDPEARRFANQTRAILQALQGIRPRDPDAPRQSGMSSDFQKKWAIEVGKINSDVVGKNYVGHAQVSAHTRRKKVGADIQLLAQARSIAAAKELRIEAVKTAIRHVKAQGHKVKSKLVWHALKELRLLYIQPDTVRKLLTQIRRDRAA